MRAAALGDLPGRLKIIFEGVREVAERYAPTCASIEIVFVNVNPQSTLLLGQARGAALTALVTGGLEVNEYTALQMKQAVAGHGKAGKAQVQEMVKRLLRLPALPGSDAADALGLAITHAHAGAAMSRLAQATDTARRASGMYKGGRTYWQPPIDGDAEEKSDLPQEVLDKKALNCVTWHLAAALCAFDGKRLAKQSEIVAVFKNGTANQYPWQFQDKTAYNPARSRAQTICSTSNCRSASPSMCCLSE